MEAKRNPPSSYNDAPTPSYSSTSASFNGATFFRFGSNQIAPKTAFCSTRRRWWRTSSRMARKIPINVDLCMSASNRSLKASRPDANNRGVDAAHEDVDGRVVVDDARRLGRPCSRGNAAEAARPTHSSTSLIGSFPARSCGVVHRRSNADNAAANRGRVLPTNWPRREFLVFQQTPHQLLPRPRGRTSTSSHRGKTCCDLISISQLATATKSPTAPDVQLLQHRQVIEILVRDGGNRNVGDLDLVLPHQIEQQSSGPRNTARSTRKSDMDSLADHSEAADLVVRQFCLPGCGEEEPPFQLLKDLRNRYCLFRPFLPYNLRFHPRGLCLGRCYSFFQRRRVPTPEQRKEEKQIVENLNAARE